MTAQEYLNSKGFYNTNVLRNTHHEEVKITDMLREYATEAIKADRERVANINTYVDPPFNFNNISFAEVEKQVILNLPIELK